MNGEEWRRLDDRLREIETTTAVTADKVDRIAEQSEDLNELVDEIRIHMAERKGEEKQLVKQSRVSGGVTGGIVSGALFGITQGIAAVFKGS